MVKIALFVSELGGGRGHIARLSAVASVARSSGYRTVLVHRSHEALVTPFVKACFEEILEGPVFPRLRNIPDLFKVRGLASSLAKVGFVDHQIISAMVEQWHRLIAAYHPRIIVGDFAPYARLASLRRVPFLMVGSGYTLPTSEGLLPFTFSKPGRDPARLSQFIADQTNKAQALIGSDAIRDPSECLRGDWNKVACIPLLDPASGRHHEEYIGPMEDFPESTAPHGNSRRVYAYLHSATEIECSAISALTELGYHVEIFCDGNFKGRLEAVVKLPCPRSFDQIVQSYDLVLHQGGLGLSMLCIQAAIPQLLSPKHTEASMTAQKLETSGLGLLLSPHREMTPEALEPFLMQLAEGKRTKQRIEHSLRTRDWIKQQNWRAGMHQFLL